jgi:glutaredoxin-like protein DUF836
MPTEMTEPARPTAEASAPLPDLILYGRDGCHLCDETRELLAALLAQRADAGLPTPRLVERDIASNPEWERAFLTTIPVVELADARLELATSAAQLRRLLDEGLGVVPAQT